MKKQKASGLAFIVAFNVFAIAVVLGAGELGARWIMNSASTDQDDQLPMCQPDPLTIWRYRPDVRLTYRAPEFEMQIRTNDAGLREGPIPSATDDVVTVLFVGDSFTFGWGVTEEQRYSEVLARLMADRRPGTRLRIVNAGYWMFTFDQQLVLMKEMIERYKPAIVIQGLYWIHVRSLFNHQLVRAPDGTLKAVEDPKIKVSDRGILKFQSDWLEHPPLNSQLVALIARAILNRDLNDKAGLWVDYMRPGSMQDERLWALTDEIVTETIRTLKVAGIPYLPFLIPTDVEVTGSGWSGVGWRAATPPTGVDPNLPATRLSAMFARSGASIVPLAAALQELRRSGLYYPQDGHWTAAGHAAAAEILAPHLDRALALARD